MVPTSKEVNVKGFSGTGHWATMQSNDETDCLPSSLPTLLPSQHEV